MQWFIYARLLRRWSWAQPVISTTFSNCWIEFGNCPLGQGKNSESLALRTCAAGSAQCDFPCFASEKLFPHLTDNGVKPSPWVSGSFEILNCGFASSFYKNGSPRLINPFCSTENWGFEKCQNLLGHSSTQNLCHVPSLSLPSPLPSEALAGLYHVTLSLYMIQILVDGLSFSIQWQLQLSPCLLFILTLELHLFVLFFETRSTM